MRRLRLACDRMIARLGWLGVGALLAAVLAGGLVAQQAVIGVFSRIYMGGTGSNNPVIRWGSAAPTGACVPGSPYLQKVSATDDGMLWACRKNNSGNGIWTSLGPNRDVYDIRDFGAVCDSSTDDTAAIQGAIDAALNFSVRAGEVRWAAGACNAQTLQVGPVTNPFQAGRNDPLNQESVGFAFNAPRSETVTFTASPSSAISFAPGVITSDDVGNYVFYGPLDATYQAVFGEDRVLQPTYGCEITAVLSSTTATCVATPYEWQASTPLTTTSGAKAVYITDDHNFTIDNTVFNSSGTAALDPAHVGKSMQFVVPMLPSYLTFADANRPGSHVVDERATAAPCTGDYATDNWQCPTDPNIKSKYFAATITAVIDPTHGKMQYTGLQNGSNWESLFPDYPVHGAQGGVCGGPDPNCAALASHAWGHLVPGDQLLMGMNRHLDHYVSPTWMSLSNQFQNKHTYLGNIFPYSVPADTQQRFITIKGYSPATSGLRFTGCPATGQYDIACAAIIFSKNKYFHWQDMYVQNVSGSDTDDLQQWGAYFGGLPGGGTQALGFTVSRINIAGFGVCWQLGDSNGGEMSDSHFENVAADHCGIGFRTGPGSFNTLDLYFSNLLMSFNKIGFLNYEGNMFVESGSSSFNSIDFASEGFGPFTIANYRTEGPGLVFLGGEPGLTLRSINLAEPQGSRAITGDVTVTPSDTHTVTGVTFSNVSVGVPANTFYPMSFGAGDITEADIDKVMYIPTLGAGGGAVVASVETIDSATTGTVRVYKSAAIQTAGTVDPVVYDTNKCDLTFPSGQIVDGDVGAAIALPEASVPNFWSRNVRPIITSITSATTGKCGFYLGNHGAGPVIPTGGTTTDPHLFLYQAAVIRGGGLFQFEGNVLGNGMVQLDQAGNIGGTSMNFISNQLWAPTQSPLTDFRNVPKRYILDVNLANLDLADIPIPTFNLSSNVGLEFPMTLFDVTTNVSKESPVVTSHANAAMLYDGPIPWSLEEGTSARPYSLDYLASKLIRPQMTFDTLLNPFSTFLNPATGGPTSPVQQLSWVKMLSEGGYSTSPVDGRNLRILCTFATSDTATCPFVRTESVDVTHDITNYNALTRTDTIVVASGHFTQADVGKRFQVDTCCGSGGTLPYWGYVVEIVDATHIKTRLVGGEVNFFPAGGPNTFSATVGENEPDAKWIPAIWGCKNMDLGATEQIELDSFSASQVVLKSSNVASTASCLVGVIR